MPSQRDPQLIEHMLGRTPLAGLCPAGEIGPGRRGCQAQVRSASMMLFRPVPAAERDGHETAIDRNRGSEMI
jgi:hypothetical protein